MDKRSCEMVEFVACVVVAIFAVCAGSFCFWANVQRHKVVTMTKQDAGGFLGAKTETTVIEYR